MRSTRSVDLIHPDPPDPGKKFFRWTADYIIETGFMFPTTMFYNFVFVDCTIILPMQAIKVWAILMNSYIEIITGLTCKGLSKNIFVIAIYTNTVKVSDSRNKTSFDYYRSLTKGGRTLVEILSLAYLHSKAQMLFAIFWIAYPKNVITSLPIKKLTTKN